MARFKFDGSGLEEYIKALDVISGKAQGMIKRAVYDGAKVVGEAFVAQIGALPENKFEGYIAGDYPIIGITHAQKVGLLEGFGFAKMENNSGYINTKVGFEGYNSVVTKKYPNGQPNALIANAVNSGTSRRAKTNFVGKAIKQSNEAAKSAMAARFDADMEKLIER